MTDGVVESVYTEVLAVVAATPAQVESVYTETLGTSTAPVGQVESVYTESLTAVTPTSPTTSALLDAVHLQALVKGASDARLDAVSVSALVQGASQARLDALHVQYLIAFKMDVFLDAVDFEVLIPVEHLAGTSEAPWIPTTVPTSTMLVWLPDPPPSLELPSEGAWGLIVAINH